MDSKLNYRYTLGDYIGFEESLKDEFKEFMFKIDTEMFLSEVEIENIVRKGKLPDNFNEMILGNLYHYFQVYLPKYISAFANCEELEEGYFYVGVSNFGEITGIPYNGELTLEDLKDLMDTIRNSVSLEMEAEDKDLINELFSQIKVELHKLDVDMDLIPEETEKEIEAKIYRLKKSYQDYQAYIMVRDKWLEELHSFTNKISYIMLDRKIRNDIAKYIRENASHRNNIADILESDIELEILNGLQLADYKSDDDNIYYWVMFYKDYIIDKIRSRKPVKPEYIQGDINHIYLEYLRCITKLRNKMICNNQKMSYYMIKVRIPGKKKYGVYYRHPVYEWKWLMKIRTIGAQGPCCM
jgi:hypothetical protein